MKNKVEFDMPPYVLNYYSWDVNFEKDYIASDIKNMELGVVEISGWFTHPYYMEYVTESDREAQVIPEGQTIVYQTMDLKKKCYKTDQIHIKLPIRKESYIEVERDYYEFNAFQNVKELDEIITMPDDTFALFRQIIYDSLLTIMSRK